MSRFKLQRLALSQAILVDGEIATLARWHLEDSEEYLDYLKVLLLQDFVASFQYACKKGGINALEVLLA